MIARMLLFLFFLSAAFFPFPIIMVPFFHTRSLSPSLSAHRIVPDLPFSKSSSLGFERLPF
ncbi:hypothetical protein IE53DRAFT_384018 [Violaceomyces palustris]|uniref:Uncharacterized protein n=1 Tax=Violaceomyces palustris TaxID=1673888 RepID=A0ACD0P5V1_9BASI|nr:hypothetical protein IE53DRAFT_384018 [Violaceomyces palustris]